VPANGRNLAGLLRGRARTPAMSTSGAAHTNVPGMLCDSDAT